MAICCVSLILALLDEKSQLLERDAHITEPDK